MADILIGIDEAGMGTLAGPLTVGVVVIEATKVPSGVRDSKKNGEARREELAASIMDVADFYSVVTMGPEEIDRCGLSDCWKRAVRSAAIDARMWTLGECREIILDGNRLVGLPYVRPVVKADDKYPAVSAASILAKYTQCCAMDDYHVEYPRYGFNRHRGYGTANHKKMLEEFGPCPIHRKSFRPVRKAL
jgi:ribonuclease HII